MEKLLKRWAELEPRWAKLAQDTIPPDSAYHIGAWAHAGYYVQIVAQQAIEARGWMWSVGSPDMYSNVGPGLCSAIVCDEDDIQEQDTGDTPAEALLRAYLAALESIATEDADA